jgi:hypothetical protein
VRLTTTMTMVQLLGWLSLPHLRVCCLLSPAPLLLLLLLLL